jgi:hypothetical protein
MNLQDYFSPNIEDRRDEDYRPDPLFRLLPPAATPQQVLEHQMVLDRPNPYVEMFAPKRSQPVFGLTAPRPFLPQQQDIFSRQPAPGSRLIGPVDNWGQIPRIGGDRNIAEILGN